MLEEMVKNSEEKWNYEFVDQPISEHFIGEKVGDNWTGYLGKLLNNVCRVQYSFRNFQKVSIASGYDTWGIIGDA